MRRMVSITTAGGLAATLLAAPPASAAPPPKRSIRSGPPDRTIFRGQPGRGATGLRTLAAGVTVIDATAAASSVGGNEPSIAVNPVDPRQIAITRFTFAWNNNADLLFTRDGGATWANEKSIPPPPGVAGTAGCPCDQTIDYGRNGLLYGTFLTLSPDTVVTGVTGDPTSPFAWNWNGAPTQLTSGDRTDADQPQLVVNRDTANAGQDNAYVGYDDLAVGPDARVAASYGAFPVNITNDSKAGSEGVFTNPGLRLAADPRNGTMYALYEQSSGNVQPKSVTYKLNRSTDGGRTWTLNGSADGLTVDTVNSDQAPGFKFGGVNALLGGVDHAAVDPANGDVYVAYGQDVSGGNQIKIRRLTADGSGDLGVGPATNVSASTNAALPSVAVNSNGTIGVLYDTFDGNTADGFPIFTAHLARSTDHGASFDDTVLQTFQSPQTNNTGDDRQRVLGDYHQLKAVGDTFYGVFAGNTSGVPASGPPIDAIFFKATP